MIICLVVSYLSIKENLPQYNVLKITGDSFVTEYWLASAINRQS